MTDEPCNTWWHNVMLDNGIDICRLLLEDAKTADECRERLDGFKAALREREPNRAR